MLDYSQIIIQIIYTYQTEVKVMLCFWMCLLLNQTWNNVSTVPTSDVMARLGLKALAWAQLLKAQALS
jgi:hypothetical protein